MPLTFNQRLHPLPGADFCPGYIFQIHKNISSQSCLLFYILLSILLNPMNYKLIDMEVHGDRRGKLISLEGMKNVPFDIKRIYYMFDTLPNEARGFHAHKELEQIIIAMDGACRFILDDGEKREQVLLNRPDVGLYIGKNMWREMHDFSYGCKLVVLASEYYDEKEYIRNYDDFLKSLKD